MALCRPSVGRRSNCRPGARKQPLQEGSSSYTQPRMQTQYDFTCQLHLLPITTSQRKIVFLLCGLCLPTYLSLTTLTAFFLFKISWSVLKCNFVLIQLNSKYVFWNVFSCDEGLFADFPDHKPHQLLQKLWHTDISCIFTNTWNAHAQNVAMQ